MTESPDLHCERDGDGYCHCRHVTHPFRPAPWRQRPAPAGDAAVVPDERPPR